MDVFTRLIKLKPNSDDKVQKWARMVNDRRDEAIATLESEGVAVESWFSLSLEGEDYLILYMRSDSLVKADAAGKSSEHPIDEIHQQFKVDTWVRGAGGVGKLLVDLDASSHATE